MKYHSRFQRSTHIPALKSCIILLLIITGITYTLSGQQLKINPGAYIHIGGSAYLNINNSDLINNGTYIKGAETVIFSGNSTRTVSGTSDIDMYNLLVTNTSGITTLLGLLTTNNLTVGTGGKFTIDPAKKVTVNGILGNSAGYSGMLLKSDIIGTASLINSTVSVPSTVQRYISGAAEAWHFLSSPVSDQNIGGLWLPSGTYGTDNTGYDLYVWNESNSCWIYKNDITSAINWGTVHPGTDFTSGRGYLYSVQALNPTKEFSGNLNTGNLNYGVTFNATDLTMRGFNLVGNPYPSSIDWQEPSGWDRTSLVSSGGGYDLWIWNSSANNYGICNSFSGVTTNGVTRYIAPMQGFFIKAAISGTVQMDNLVRVHAGTENWLKKGSGTDFQKVRLVVSSESDSSFDEVQLLFGFKNNEPSTTKLFSRVSSAPSLFLPFQGENNSVRYLTDTLENPSIPVRFRPGIDGSYKITCHFVQYNFEKIFLEDKLTHQIQDMKESDVYSFHASKNDDENRFMIHFRPVFSNSEKVLPARIYTDGNRLIIDLTLISRETDALIYNSTGSLLLHQILQGNTEHSLNVKAHSEILIVRLRNPDGNLNHKLVWMENR